MIGERDRQFKSLEIAVGQFTARPLGGSADTAQLEQPGRLVAREIPRGAPDLKNTVSK
jgi:hypothetical protein